MSPSPSSPRAARRARAREHHERDYSAACQLAGRYDLTVDVDGKPVALAFDAPDPMERFLDNPRENEAWNHDKALYWLRTQWRPAAGHAGAARRSLSMTESATSSVASRRLGATDLSRHFRE